MPLTGSVTQDPPVLYPLIHLTRALAWGAGNLLYWAWGPGRVDRLRKRPPVRQQQLRKEGRERVHVQPRRWHLMLRS